MRARKEDWVVQIHHPIDASSMLPNFHDNILYALLGGAQATKQFSLQHANGYGR